ncbi:Ku protein [Planctomicrobium sp. SH527]|uniref:Ku protein n=1 Tax=Planctomicrobium sp. SH527 TaxID=3448123 RepID=UPI003F5C60E8
MPVTRIVSPAEHEDQTIPRSSRASWTGQLKFGNVAIPVKAYALTVTSPSGPLCQVHTGCGQKIEYRKCCPVHGQVPNEEIGKAYPYAENDLIELSEADLEPLAPQPEHIITLKQFFEPDQLQLPLLSGRSFQLIPAHAAALVPYQAFAKALQQSGVGGFGTIGLSGRIQLLFARAMEQSIQLFLLHWPAQCRIAPEVELSESSEVLPLSKQFQRMIREQIGPSSWKESRDDWELCLAELVQAKVAARTATLQIRPGTRASRTTAGKSRSARSRKPARAA